MRLRVSAVNLSLTHARRTKPAQSKLYRFGRKARFGFGLSNKFDRDIKLDVDQFPAIRTDRVVVTLDHPVKPTRTITKLDLRYMTVFLQVSKRIVNRCETNARQQLFSGREYLVRRQVVATVANHLKHDPTLSCQAYIVNLLISPGELDLE